jgi:glycine/D-amino acid oxidase-like deaminating enzyme
MRASVIGAGVNGCAAAWELQRRGFDVTVLDRLGEAGHGSTSASCGIVRRFYAQPGMTAMAHESAQIWADWDAHVGPIDEETIVFNRPGMLFIPPRLDEGVRGIVAEMQRLGIKASILSAEEIAQRFPFLDTASNFPPKPADHPAFLEPTGRRIEGAVFEEDAGYVVSPALATHNMRLAAERDGVRFLMNREVTRIESAAPRGFRLHTVDGKTLETDVVVNVAGPHSAKVNRMAGVTLPLETRPLRREVHALANPMSEPGKGMQVPVVGDLDGGIYFRPESGGRELIVGSTDPDCDTLEWVEEPDAFDTGITEAYRQRQCLRLMKRFPEVRLGRPRGLAAMYDVTLKDWYPIVDRTDLPGYYVCIGTSGSSFKTSPVLGRLTAEIVEACEGGRDTDRDPIRLSLPRIGTSIDTLFLSRRRGAIRTSGTVIG